MAHTPTLKRRELLRLAAITGVAVACTPVTQTPSGPSASAAPSAAAKPHGKLTIAGGVPVDLQANNILAGFTYGAVLFDGLTWSGPKGVLAPRLATEWKVLDDKSTWEFKLREGVTFSNGEPFNAEAVKFTVETTLSKNLRWAGRIATIKSVQAVNDYTVRITTNGPDALLPGRMTIYMLPPKQVTADGLDKYGLNPSGTGSYVVDKYTPSQFLSLKYREDSWRVGKIGVAGKPLQIEWPQNITNAATRIAALKAGNVDVAADVPIDEIEALTRDGFTITAAKEASPVAYFLITDLEQANPPANPLRNKLVRQALNYAVNKDEINSKLFKGYVGDSPGQLVAEDGFGYNPNIKAFPYDPDKAKSLLAQAGFPNGFTTKIGVLAGSTTSGETTGQAVAAYLDKVGVKAEITPMDGAQWIQKWYGGGRSQMFVANLNYLPVYDGDFSYSWFWSKNQPAPARFYNNPEFDRIFEAQRQELDRPKREALLQQLGQIMYDDAVVLFLYRQGRADAMKKTVKGYVRTADQGVYYDEVSLE